MGYAVGTLSLRIRVEHSRSLKDKRQLLRSLKERLRRRHNVAVAEVGGQDRLRDSDVVAVTVATTAGGARQVLDAARANAADVLGRSLCDDEIDIEAF